MDEQEKSEIFDKEKWKSGELPICNLLDRRKPIPTMQRSLKGVSSDLRKETINYLKEQGVAASIKSNGTEYFLRVQGADIEKLEKHFVSKDPTAVKPVPQNPTGGLKGKTP